jgi:hypothetical protein
MKRTRPRIHRYEIKTPHRTGTVTFREEADKTVQKLRFTRYGDFGDMEQIATWLWPLILKHDRPGVPFVAHHPLSGQVVTIYDPGIAFVRQCQA